MSDSNLDGKYYDELRDQMREYGASIPSPPAAVQQPLRPPNQTATSTENTLYYAREYNIFEDQFGQALDPSSRRYLGAPTPFFTPAARGIPAGSQPKANPAATAAVSPVASQAAAPATIPAGQQSRRNKSQNPRRRRKMLWRLYSSFTTTSAETETSQPRREAWVRGLSNVRQILCVDDNKDHQQNSGEVSGTQDGTSENSNDGRATRSLLAPDERGEEEGELRFPQYKF
ncbi:hypothetical protein NEUTE1DRAFT_103964 [Neurospora tetrasperma FGSC 2508]|uniref:Uncharacterized protein n=1 Tax=Neurospora tetrasperma (strain FGSC 2508 / ATCC MYA-4615 / P0657) TaxID=510951 RepID=F8MXP5_NEUT8|nr:uncharacterized protein NEUTE1DRAFT_103964 [Neurospora tetrasperma FGSC 2508]EGO54516.1 hypothetical protein NEUTE1DRAFT_103964 [Neurospora tetrasperma FGSC 2508]EGZ76050.1 hypothetical protein NEUTE2DRAFT_170581 [Neurospora tetrasperma FGSC 2509]